MVSQARFKSMINDFKSMLDYFNGFRDLMLLDALLDVDIEGNIVSFNYLNNDKIVSVELDLAKLKQSYDEWLKEDKND